MASTFGFHCGLQGDGAEGVGLDWGRIADRPKTIKAYSLCSWAILRFSGLLVSPSGMDEILAFKRGDVGDMGIRHYLGGAISTLLANPQPAVFNLRQNDADLENNRPDYSDICSQLSSGGTWPKANMRLTTGPA